MIEGIFSGRATQKLVEAVYGLSRRGLARRAAAGAVFFDRDGVLTNTNPFHRRAWRRVCREVGRAVSEGELRCKVFGWCTGEAIVNLWGEQSSRDLVKALAARREEIFRALAVTNIRPARGLLAFLDFLQGAGLALALATSACRDNVESLLSRLGLSHGFAATVLATQVGRGKSDRAVSLVAAPRLGVEVDECVVIEDFLLGVAAGKRAGMRCAALSTTKGENESRAAGADFVGRDFRSRKLKAFMQGEQCDLTCGIRRGD